MADYSDSGYLIGTRTFGVQIKSVMFAQVSWSFMAAALYNDCRLLPEYREISGPTSRADNGGGWSLTKYRESFFSAIVSPPLRARVDSASLRTKRDLSVVSVASGDYPLTIQTNAT